MGGGRRGGRGGRGICSDHWQGRRCGWGGGVCGCGCRAPEAPEVVHPGDSADEVVVGHVGESGEVGLWAGGGGNAATSAEPLTGALGVGMCGVV